MSVPSIIQKAKSANKGSNEVLVIVCAYNEESTLPHLLNSLNQAHVIVVNDGSSDSTGKIAGQYPYVEVISHQRRMGKAASLQEAIEHARMHDIIVEVDADAIPEEYSLDRLISKMRIKGVGGVSARQIPIGPKNVAFKIDELLWSVLAFGKAIQQSKYGYCHLGAVMYAFRPEFVSSIAGSINDDEELGYQIRSKGMKTIFAWDAVVYFDASSSIGHIIERRKRMIMGHMMYPKSIAPSMDFGIVGIALVKSIMERPRRIVWAIPAIILELYARLIAWRDSRNPKRKSKFIRWVTNHAKNSVSDFFSRTKC